MIDTGILELLASKICHDLISPVGAISNGLEIMEEMGAEAGPDVTALIAFSAAQASAKLKAYRMAYGMGGADSNIKPEDVFNVIEALVQGDRKIRQDWDPKTLPQSGYPHGYCKMLTCALLLAAECLPRGGTLSVRVTADHITLVRAEGENASFKEKTQDALDLKLEAGTREPKYAHALLSALLARHYGFRLAAVPSGAGAVGLALAPAGIAG